MRGLITIIFCIVPQFCLGTILVGCTDSSAGSSPSFFISAQQNGTSQQTGGKIVVDSDVDEVKENPCTEAPNDCTLRDAIRIANSREGGTSNITFATQYMFHLASPLPTISANGTTIKANSEQEIHIDGENTNGNVLRITGNNVEIMGLRIYGAGLNHTNIRITDNAQGVVIAKNIIGDDDGPDGNCGSSQFSYGGILVDSSEKIETGKTRAWIYGNIIECHEGNPGDGIVVFADGVIVGKDKQGNAVGNLIRSNRGWGINLTNSTGNTISGNELSNNNMGPVNMNNFHNNWSNNTAE